MAIVHIDLSVVVQLLTARIETLVGEADSPISCVRYPGEPGPSGDDDVAGCQVTLLRLDVEEDSPHDQHDGTPETMQIRGTVGVIVSPKRMQARPGDLYCAVSLIGRALAKETLVEIIEADEESGDPAMRGPHSIDLRRVASTIEANIDDQAGFVGGVVRFTGTVTRVSGDELVRLPADEDD